MPGPARKAECQDVLLKVGIGGVIHHLYQAAFGILVCGPDNDTRHANGVAQHKRVAPPPRQVLVAEGLEGRTGPGHGMHPVGDAMDGIARKHATGDLAMFHSHTVDELCTVQRQIGHIQPGRLTAELEPVVHGSPSMCRASSLN